MEMENRGKVLSVEKCFTGRNTGESMSESRTSQEMMRWNEASTMGFPGKPLGNHWQNLYFFGPLRTSDGSGMKKVGFGWVRVYPNFQKSGSGGK